jgi:hypothetical protein
MGDGVHIIFSFQSLEFMVLGSWYYSSWSWYDLGIITHGVGTILGITALLWKYSWNYPYYNHNLFDNHHYNDGYDRDNKNYNEQQPAAHET